MNNTYTKNNWVYPVKSSSQKAKKQLVKKVGVRTRSVTVKTRETAIDACFSSSVYAVLWSILFVVPYFSFIVMLFNVLGTATAFFTIGVFVVPFFIYSLLAYFAGLQIIVRYEKEGRREYISIINLFWAAHFSHDEQWLKNQQNKLIEINQKEATALAVSQRKYKSY